MSGGRSVFTGLKANTHFGRPQLNSMLSAVHRAHPTVSDLVPIDTTAVKYVSIVAFYILSVHFTIGLTLMLSDKLDISSLQYLRFLGAGLPW